MSGPSNLPLDYEALAEKKRKALAEMQGEGSSKKARKEDISEEIMDEIMQAMNYGGRRKSRKRKKLGRRMGLRNKLSPQIKSMVGDATLHYGNGRFKEAISVLNEVVKLAPNFPHLYHMLGLSYKALGDNKRSFQFYMIAGLLKPKDPDLWKLLFTWSLEQQNVSQICYCLSKAIMADPTEISLRYLQASLYVELGDYQKAAESYEQIQQISPDDVEALKSGAKVFCSVLQSNRARDHADLVTEVADTYMTLGHFSSALKYYYMLENDDAVDDDHLHLKIAQCHLSLGEKMLAIEFFQKALQRLENNVDARLNLASLLIEDSKEDEAISLLSPPQNFDLHNINENSDASKSWWLNGKIKLKLCNIYRAKGIIEDFVNTILPLVRESLYIESLGIKIKVRKRLRESDLFERVKKVDDQQTTDGVFCGSRPIGTPADRMKAARARRMLQKKAALKEEKKAAAIAAGLDWHSDDGNDETEEEHFKEPPLANLLKDEEHQDLIIDLCKALESLERYYEALDIIKLALKSGHSILPVEKQEQLRSLGAQMAYNTMDSKHGYDCIKHIVQQHPYSITAWNCYYKVIPRSGKIYSRHCKFLRSIRSKHKDCVPSVVISGHQFSMGSHHQDAAREYLEAYKMLPENPLINLCVGSTLINLTLGFRLQNKHQCLAQGLAFLYNNLRLCENSQEALYNIGRACHHVGLVTLAVSYYEKVLASTEEDRPIPKLPNENWDHTVENRKKDGYCDLRREAAFNLHLIYKKCGAMDLARQVLKDYCTFD